MRLRPAADEVHRTEADVHRWGEPGDHENRERDQRKRLKAIVTRVRKLVKAQAASHLCTGRLSHAAAQRATVSQVRVVSSVPNARSIRFMKTGPLLVGT